jgi:hypothetical protein
MTYSKQYISNFRSHWGLFSSGARIILISAFFLFLSFVQLAGQETQDYDEISVYLDVKGVGGREMDAVIQGEQIFLPVTDLFDFLKIRNVASAGLDSVYGSFIDPEARFYINRVTNRIIYQERVYNLPVGELIRTETNLYMKSELFGRIFGLDCYFSFRNLSVTVTSKLELPLIREMKQEEMRRNLSRLKGEIKADTSIDRIHPGFRFGMADWSAIVTEEVKGRTDARLNLSLGSMVAGGEATFSLNYYTMDRFSEKQQNYLWRYVNNDFSPLRQIMAGKITTQATSTIYNPVIGVQFTNTPTSFRRSFGTYTLSDKTEPGWIVELYVNNVLVDYVKADASGFFTFQVPLVYGNTIVKLRYYGPWGEERTKEQNINIPFNFLPEKTFEYTVSAGIVEDTLMSRFSRASLNYGLTKGITIGGGVEYLSSVTSGPAMPFVKASFRLSKNILLSGDYTYGVRASGTLSYRLPSDLQLDLNYKWYHPGQTAIKFNYREERKISASMPLRIRNFTSFNRFSVNQLIFPGSQYTSGEYLFSSTFWGVNTNFTTYGLFIADAEPYFYSNLSLSVRLPAKFSIMPQAQYSYSANKFLSAKIRVEKPFAGHAFINASYERNFINDMNLAELGIRYDFNFARSGMSVRQSGKTTSFVQHASGSLISDHKTRFMMADNRTNVGRGGITVIPFFDLNSNGIKDPGEQKVHGLNLKANGGRIINVEKDTTIRIIGLEPYTSCFIELDQYSFDNISWQLAFRTVSVIIDPDILKTVMVPVNVEGEANGTVTIEENGQKRGTGRVKVNFYTMKNKFVGRTITEDDGYFSYFGLKPGRYYVKADTGQLRKLNMTSDPDSVPFAVSSGIDGDIIDGLDLNLRMKRVMEEVLPEVNVTPGAPLVKSDTSYIIVHEIVEEVITVAEDSYAIQLGAFRQKRNAEILMKKLQDIFGKNVGIVVADNFYKVRINDIKTRAEADEKIEILRKNGITELWLVSLRAKQQQRILLDKADSVAVIRNTVDTAAISPEVLARMSIQVGAFRSKNYAEALKRKLSATVNNPVEVFFEDGYYKVRINGFTNRLDVERLLPTLGMMGIYDLWVPRVDVPVQPQKPAIVTPEPNVPEQKVKPETKPEVKAPEVPPVSMRVGEFIKKYQALRAQRKIRNKLGLESVIVERWGYYYIIIGGFYTREETYKYYPELAGLGLTRISVIDTR